MGDATDSEGLECPASLHVGVTSALEGVASYPTALKRKRSLAAPRDPGNRHTNMRL
jgi:hypothetical protein